MTEVTSWMHSMKCAEMCTTNLFKCCVYPPAPGLTSSWLLRGSSESVNSWASAWRLDLQFKYELPCRVPVDSVISIYMQEAQLHVKRTHHLLKAAASKYASRSALCPG